MTALILDMEEFRRRKRAAEEKEKMRLFYAQIDKLIQHLKKPGDMVIEQDGKITVVPKAPDGQ